MLLQRYTNVDSNLINMKCKKEKPDKCTAKYAGI